MIHMKALTKMKFPLILVMLLPLTGCSLLGLGGTAMEPTADTLATEVAQIVSETLQAEPPSATNTAEPSSTTIATDPPTSPPPQPTATDEPPTATPAPTQTPSPQPSATAISGDPASALGAPSWEDDLSSTRNYYLYENDHTIIQDGGGALELKGLTKIGWHGWSMTYMQEPVNFYLEGTFRVGSCGGSDLYGLIFRGGKESFGYFYGITCDGRYNLYRRDFRDGTAVRILTLKESPAIVQGSGAVNRIAVRATGKQLSLYVNGQLLESVDDGSYDKGFFGPFIAPYSGSLDIFLDHLRLWNLD